MRENLNHSNIRYIRYDPTMNRVQFVALVLATLMMGAARVHAQTQVLDELTVTTTEAWSTICEYGSSKSLSCPTGSVIKVVQAFVGAWADSTSEWCGYIDHIPSCKADVTSVAADKCNGKQSCAIPNAPAYDAANSGTSILMQFYAGVEDPCPRTWKYTLITYDCYPRPPLALPGTPSQVGSSVPIFLYRG